MKNKIIKLTSDLIKFKSVTSNSLENKRCIDFVFKNIGDVKFKKVYQKNGVYTLIATHKKTKTPNIFFHGHLDVVPVKDDSQFKPIVKGDKLYGRGGFDMKGGCAVIIELFKNNPDKNIGIMLTTDEEIGGFNGAKYMMGLGYKAKFIVSVEPSWERIGAEAKGILQLEIETLGKQAHSAYTWYGENAFHKQVQAIAGLIKKYGTKISKKDYWETSMNFNVAQAGIAFNILPSNSIVKVDVRYIPTDDPKKILRDIKNVFKNSKIDIVFNEPSAKCDKSNPYLKKLKKQLNLKDPFIKKHGASDVRHFTSKGIDGVVYGPKGAEMHGDNEHVSISSLVRVYKTLQKIID